MDLPSAIEWKRNPDYGNDKFTAELSCDDRILVAVPLHEDSGGGHDFQIIIPTETGFRDSHGEAWSEWSWKDVEYYSVLKPISASLRIKDGKCPMCGSDIKDKGSYLRCTKCDFVLSNGTWDEEAGRATVRQE